LRIKRKKIIGLDIRGHETEKRKLTTPGESNHTPYCHPNQKAY